MCYIKTSPNYHKKRPGNPRDFYCSVGDWLTGSGSTSCSTSRQQAYDGWLAAAPRRQSTNHMYDDIGGFTWLLGPWNKELTCLLLQLLK